MAKKKSKSKDKGGKAAGKPKTKLSRAELTPLDWLGRIEKPLAYGVGGVTVMWTLGRVSAFWV